MANVLLKRIISNFFIKYNFFITIKHTFTAIKFNCTVMELKFGILLFKGAINLFVAPFLFSPPLHTRIPVLFPLLYRFHT